MNILITGALGFFGLNLTRTLASHATVRVVASDVRQPTQAQRNFIRPVAERIDFCPLDVQDRHAIHTLLEERQITHIVHAAALTPTAEQEQRQPTHIVDINLIGTINLLDAAIQSSSIQRVIVASSSGVYGASPRTKDAMQHEAGPLALDDLYSITKYSAELLTQRYSQLSPISMVAVRLAALYGPLERASTSRPNISAMGKLMDAMLNRRPIIVAGPSIHRDWTYMEDAANAVLALMQADQLNHSVYNIGCGVSVSWKQVVDAFVTHGLSATWSDDVETADVAMRPAQERLTMDISRLQQDTGFVPRYPIMDGVEAYSQRESENW